MQTFRPREEMYTGLIENGTFLSLVRRPFTNCGPRAEAYFEKASQIVRDLLDLRIGGTSMPDTRALYYPYSRCVDATTLKRLVLVFDEVWFIDPVPLIMREGLMTGSYVAAAVQGLHDAGITPLQC